jgi:hypothetical protein
MMMMMMMINVQGVSNMSAMYLFPHAYIGIGNCFMNQTQKASLTNSGIAHGTMVVISQLTLVL